jgi:serine/threonine protein kinase/Tol biopolymer transport system component
MAAIASGTKLGRYEVRSMLGAGGMGEVYLAHDLQLKRSVALKVLPADVLGNRMAMHRFVQEARAASALSHPNIAHIYEISRSKETSFIAMEYIEGETLRERLSSRQPRPLSEILHIAIQVASALSAAHAAGIVHRDIKPENIMLHRDGFVKVLDFGLAKQVRALPSSIDPKASTIGRPDTDAGTVLGTVSYMSPEQARGLPVDAQTDIWSLGVILYEMITGRLPFEGAMPNDAIAAILEHEPMPLARFTLELPEAVEWTVMKALTKDRKGRYQTAKELLIDLEKLKSRLEVQAELSRYLPPEEQSREMRLRSYERASAGDISTAQNNSAPEIHSMSSAEYIVTEIRRHKKKALALVLCAVLLVGFAGYMVLSKVRSRPSQQRTLHRLTFDSGLQNTPTWSPDGRLIAYSSDRGGNFDIWIQQVSGGDPIQVTRSQAHDWEPDWSPDGNSIVFRSEREGGGLFVIPAFGGRERKISSFGYRPRWSPDGSKILFLSPGTRIYDYPKVYLVSLAEQSTPSEILTSVEGDPEPVKKGFVSWYPDSRRVSFWGDGGAFWTVPLDGGPPVKSELSDAVKKQIETASVDFGDFRWSPKGDALYFEGTSRGVKNLWKIIVDSKTLKWLDGPERLTTGFSTDTDITLSADGSRLAFTSVNERTRVWFFPFDARSGQIKGDGQPVTSGDMDAWFPDLSPDGKRLVFTARRNGLDKQELWESWIKEDRKQLLASDDSFRFAPRWSPDSARLAYSRFRPVDSASVKKADLSEATEKAGPIVLLNPESGEEQPLTSTGPWLDYMYDWSPDGQFIIGSTNRQSPQRWVIALFPLSAAPHAETEMRVVASNPEQDLWAPRFSPDGNWICYVAQKTTRAGVSVIYVIPSSGGEPVRITMEDAWADKPRWSLDGKTIYFISNRNSAFLNVWGIRFDPVKGRPEGEPFRVTGFASPSLMISTQMAYTEISLSKSSLALPITEVAGSIWIIENVGD